MTEYDYIRPLCFVTDEEFDSLYSLGQKIKPTDISGWFYESGWITYDEYVRSQNYLKIS